jgi:hypothetical protein
LLGLQGLLGLLIRLVLLFGHLFVHIAIIVA